MTDRQSDKSSPPAPAQSSLLDGNLGLVEGAIQHVLIGSGSITSDPMGGDDKPSPLPPGDMNHTSEPSLVLNFDIQALQRLISRAVPRDELPSAIETITSNAKPADIAGSLRGGDAQTFIDIIDEVC